MLKFRTKALRSMVPEPLFLNGVAVLGALIGLANLVLTVAIFGTSDHADVWMLSVSVIQALVLLSQMGVEQFAIFSAAQRNLSARASAQFDGESLSWSLISGAAFSALLVLVVSSIVTLFANGFNEDLRPLLQSTLLPLFLQVSLAPMLFVLRQQLLLKGRPKVAVLLNSTFAIVQLIALLASLSLDEPSPPTIAQFIGIGSLLAVIAALRLAGPIREQFAIPNWGKLWPFIRASIALRFTHSIHNLLVTLLTNSVLSNGTPGTVSLFHYARRIIDGLLSVTMGPHMQVYHAAQADSWIRRDKRSFHANIRCYLSNSLPVMTGALLFLVFAWYFAEAIIKIPSQLTAEGVFWVSIAILLWQLLISIESVSAGVLAMERRTFWLFLVNLIFISNFYLATHFFLEPPYSAITIALTSLVCQLNSFLILSLLAHYLYQKKFAISI